MPASALPAINTVADGDIPDVAANGLYKDEIYLLYNAGILTGSDNYGSFEPRKYILRSEVAAIVTRMADTSMRKTIKSAQNEALDAMQGIWRYSGEDYRNYYLTIDGNEFSLASIQWGEYFYYYGNIKLSAFNVGSSIGVLYLGDYYEGAYSFGRDILGDFEPPSASDELLFTDIPFMRTSKTSDTTASSIEILISLSEMVDMPADVYLYMTDCMETFFEYFLLADEAIYYSSDYYYYYEAYGDYRDRQDSEYYFEEMKRNIVFADEYIRAAIEICENKPYLANVKARLEDMQASYAEMFNQRFTKEGIDNCVLLSNHIIEQIVAVWEELDALLIR